MGGLKEYYKIGEISKLYDIGTDSLRYYEELGLLNPKRDSNGYRLYSLRDISRLNVIRELRTLGFSMERIKSYLDHRTLHSTLELLDDELGMIERKIAGLRRQQRDIQGRIKNLSPRGGVRFEEIREEQFPERPVLMLAGEITRDEEFDFLIKRLSRRTENTLYILGNTYIGATLPLEYLQNDIYNQFNSAFFILNNRHIKPDFILPGGTYLTLTYRGPYTQSKRLYGSLKEYAREHGWVFSHDPIELYRVDINETADPQEFVTEIQASVKEK